MAHIHEIMAMGTAAPLARMLGSNRLATVMAQGSNQANATPLTINYALIGTTGAAQGVRLGYAMGAALTALYNVGPNSVQIYPAENDAWNDQLPNVPITLLADAAIVAVPSVDHWLSSIPAAGGDGGGGDLIFPLTVRQGGTNNPAMPVWDPFGILLNTNFVVSADAGARLETFQGRIDVPEEGEQAGWAWVFGGWRGGGLANLGIGPGNPSYLLMASANGTAGALAGLNTGDVLGQVDFGGWNSGGPPINWTAASIQAIAAEDFMGELLNSGTWLRFCTTPNGNGGEQYYQTAALTAEGGLYIGSANPPPYAGQGYILANGLNLTYPLMPESGGTGQNAPFTVRSLVTADSSGNLTSASGVSVDPQRAVPGDWGMTVANHGIYSAGTDAGIGVDDHENPGEYWMFGAVGGSAMIVSSLQNFLGGVVNFMITPSDGLLYNDQLVATTLSAAPGQLPVYAGSGGAVTLSGDSGVSVDPQQIVAGDWGMTVANHGIYSAGTDAGIGVDDDLDPDQYWMFGARGGSAAIISSQQNVPGGIANFRITPSDGLFYNEQLVVTTVPAVPGQLPVYAGSGGAVTLSGASGVSVDPELGDENWGMTVANNGIYSTGHFPMIGVDDPSHPGSSWGFAANSGYAQISWSQKPPGTQPTLVITRENGLIYSGVGVGFAQSAGWTAGTDPNGVAIFINRIGRSLIIEGIVGVLEVPNGAAATVDVMLAPDGTTVANGVQVNLTSFDANSGLPPGTLQNLGVISGPIWISSGMRLGLRVNGAPSWNAAVATITVYLY